MRFYFALPHILFCSFLAQCPLFTPLYKLLPVSVSMHIGGYAELELSVSGLSTYGLPISIFWGDGQLTEVLLSANGVVSFYHTFGSYGRFQANVNIQSPQSSTHIGDCSRTFNHATARIEVAGGQK
eukprot:scaffold313017_cov19-Tisochrysis_lutea.AAC.1